MIIANNRTLVHSSPSIFTSTTTTNQCNLHYNQLVYLKRSTIQLEEMRLMEEFFSDPSKDIPEVSYHSFEAYILQYTGNLIGSIIRRSPPSQKLVDAVVELLPKCLSASIIQMKEDLEYILEPFAKLICTAGDDHSYPEFCRHNWLSNLAKHLKKRITDDISLSPIFWIYYGRSQLLLARDFFGEARAKLLKDAFEFLSLNKDDTDTRIMIGILKAELFINCRELECKSHDLQHVAEWIDIGRHFSEQGAFLDSQLHYALCLAQRIFSEPNDRECYRDVLRLLPAKFLTQFDSAEKTVDDLWWRECLLLIKDVCVRTTLLTTQNKRAQFLDQLDDRLRSIVLDTVEAIEAPSRETNQMEDRAVQSRPNSRC